MNAVIMGLVAIVLLVLVVVTLGMRSMNRRESALSSERIKAMAEGKGPKSRRPAEETFFESFPKDFDAFEEPVERTTAKQRAASPRPAPRPGGRQAARPAQRGNKQPAGPRGRRGVDEWGEPDDYDDDYWTRVRADDGAFGGTIAARMATPRPLTPADSAMSGSLGSDAVTVQAPLPQRPVAAAGLVEPQRSPTSSVMAEDKTVTFAAPTPDALSGPPLISRPDPLSPATGPFPANPTNPSQAFEADPFFAPRSTGPFPALHGTGPFETKPPATPPAVPSASTGAYESTGAYGSPRTSGSFPALHGTGPFDATPPAAPSPSTGPFAGPSTGSFDAVSGTGPFETRSTAYEPSRADSYDVTRGVTGPFSADTGPSYVIPGATSEPAAYPAPPPAASPTPGWSGARDVLDDPEPPRGTASWPSWPSGGDSHPAPVTYDGYSAYSPSPSPSPEQPYSAAPSAPSAPSSYEVSAGWATIDASDTVTGPSPAVGIPTNPSRTVSPYGKAGQSPSPDPAYYGYEQPQGYAAAEQPERSEPNPADSWPSYEEMYGTTSETSGRRGSHRNPDNDYPDYYR